MQQLAHESTGDLARIKGMTPTQAAMVVAGRRAGPPDPHAAAARPQAPRRAAGGRRATAAQLRGHPVERVGIVSLCAKHRVLRTEIVSTGTLDASLVHPREVFRMAAMHRAAAIVLFHNPLGRPHPERRRRRPDRAAAAGRDPDGIEVLDHVILADTRYCSFKEMGRL